MQDPKIHHVDDVIVLPDRLDTSHAIELFEHLSSQRGKDLNIDASSVELIGGRCLEVLLNAKHFWERDGKSITITATSPDLETNLGWLGFTGDSLATGGSA